MVVRCPKCGGVVPDGFRRTARCPACHEAFGKCRYCRSYDLQALDCTHLSRREFDHVIDPDEVVGCPDFSSRLALTQSARGPWAVLRTALIALVGASALAFLAIMMVRREERPAMAGILHLGVSLPDSVLQEEGLDLTATVVNGGQRELKQVEVKVGGRGMRGLSLKGVDPPESLLTSGAAAVSAGAPSLPPGEQCAFTFHFAATRTGKRPLVVTASAANLAGATSEAAESEIIP